MDPTAGRVLCFALEPLGGGGSRSALDARRMLRFLPAIIFGASVNLLGAGEGFGGRFSFTNKSKVELWVQTSGFERNPPCGTLVPGGLKGSVMGPMRLPSEATITWSEGYASYNNPRAEQHTNVISMLSLSNCPADATVVFEFTSNRIWRVSCERK